MKLRTRRSVSPGKGRTASDRDLKGPVFPPGTGINGANSLLVVGSYQATLIAGSSRRHLAGFVLDATVIGGCVGM